MKVSLFLFCLFLSVSAAAQNIDTMRKDTARRIMFVDARTPGRYDKFLSVIDDKPYYRRSIKKSWLRDTSNILEVKVLKGKEAFDKYGKLAENGVVVITTKKYAVKCYQNKLGAFSVDYRKYIELQGEHSQNDNGIVYEILKNEGAVFFKGDKLIRELYNMPVASIKDVDLHRKETCCGTNVSVVITTKQ
jgi:hypothetical protein